MEQAGDTVGLVENMCEAAVALCLAGIVAAQKTTTPHESGGTIIPVRFALNKTDGGMYVTEIDCSCSGHGGSWRSDRSSGKGTPYEPRRHRFDSGTREMGRSKPSQPPRRQDLSGRPVD